MKEPKDGKGQASPIPGWLSAPHFPSSIPPPSLPHASVSTLASPDIGVEARGVMKMPLNLSTEAVQKAASQSTLTIDSVDGSFHQPQQDQPSPYLRNLCPLCFNISFDRLKETLGGLPDAVL